VLKPLPIFKPKVNQDSNPDCQINPDPDVCWITPKISASVILSSFVKMAGDCMRNAHKSPKSTYSTAVRKVEN